MTELKLLNSTAENRALSQALVSGNSFNALQESCALFFERFPFLRDTGPAPTQDCTDTLRGRATALITPASA
jgi:hypothetical protein